LQNHWSEGLITFFLFPVLVLISYMAVDISVLHFIQLSFSQKKAESLGSAAPENFVAGKSPASAAPVCSNLHQSAPTRKDKGYFTGKKQNAQAQKVLLDAATEQVGQSCRTKAVTANDQIRVSCFGPGQEIATMRMRILKKHGTGIPDAVLACLAESCRVGFGKLCVSNHLWRTKLWL